MNIADQGSGSVRRIGFLLLACAGLTAGGCRRATHPVAAEVWLKGADEQSGDVRMVKNLLGHTPQTPVEHAATTMATY